MPDEARLLLAFLLALGGAYALTPRAIALATRTNFQDLPVGYKGHRRPTPYLGGAAVLGGFLLAVALAGGEFARLSPILACTLGVWALGTIDDRWPLTPSLRLAVEAVAAIALWATGLGWELFTSDAVNLAVTVVWTLGLVNAFNLMDNMDGAAATVAGVTGVAVGALALIEGDTALAVLALGLAGACAGFLPYNLAGPARIFLGDGGSLTIGFVVAASIMALPGDDAAGLPRLIAAVLLAGLPVLDTSLVMISRRRAGIPLLTGGRDHLTHRLFAKLGSARIVAAGLGVTQAILGAIAVGVTEAGAGSILVAGSLWFLAAACTVALLETSNWVPVRPPIAKPPDEGLAAAEPQPGAPREGGPGRRPSPVEIGLIAFISVSCGLSPFFFGFYDTSVWGPIGLGLFAALLGLVVVRPAALRPTAAVAFAGLAALGLWAAASILWAESADQALTGANRWMLYAALFGILIMLVRNDRLARVVLGAGTVGILGLAGYLTYRMAAGQGAELFLGRRLGEPLGYVNGLAGYLLLGLWPLVAVAERGRSAVVAGLAAGAATLLGGLVVLTQTRAILPALVVSAVVIVALVPSRPRRVWLLIVLAAGVASCLGPLLEPYDTAASSGGVPTGGVLRDAIRPLLLAAGVSGVVWGLIRAVTDPLRPRVREGPAGLRRVAATVPFALVGVGLLIGLAAVGDPVGKVERQYGAFVELDTPASTGSRFTTGGGNRYDYWRIAWGQFRGDPLIGVGAGNYDRTYFLERRTTEDVKQPHSVELQVLSELGVPGALGLGAFILAVFAGLGRRAWRGRKDRRQIDIAVAAGGTFLVWLVSTSVDWLHLIPGATGIALGSAAVLVGPWARRRARRGAAPLRIAMSVGCVVLALLGAALIGKATLADRHRADAQDVLADDPRAALGKTADSLAFNDEALATYYTRAAAFARLDDYASARATLLEATRREPHDYVPRALLGDLAVRRGDLAQARSDYRRASRLNPRDPTLRTLASKPGLALESN